MSFAKPIFTTRGKQIELQGLEGQQIVFTKIKIGDGRITTQSPSQLTDLINVIAEAPITSLKRYDAYAAIRSVFQNIDVPEAFWWREVGLFAIDPATKEEVLYAYQNAYDTAEYITPSSLVTKKINWTIYVDDGENLGADIHKKMVFCSVEDLDEHNDLEGAHEAAFTAHNTADDAHDNRFNAHNDDGNAHDNLFRTVEFNVNCNSTSSIEDGTIENPFKTIMGCINAIPVWCKNVDIHISAGTYAEDVILNNPNLCVTVDGNPLDRTEVEIKSITMNVDRLTLRYLTIYDIYDIVNGKHGIRVDACNYFYVDYCKVKNTNKHEDVYGICAFGCTAQLEHNIIDGYKYGIAAAYGASAMTYNNQISNAHAGLFANMGVIYDLSNNVFIDCEKEFECFGGTVVTNQDVYINVPDGSTKAISDITGAFNIGDIKWSSADLTQAGFLIANGAEVGRATYPDLCAVYEAMGFPWGAGDGSTTFNLPNLIGKFAEGADSAGGYKEAGLPNIEGQFYHDGFAITNYPPSGAYSSENKGFQDLLSTSTYASGYIKFDASNSNSIYGNSDTVQPNSALLIPYVKAFAGASADSTDLAISEVANDVARLSANIVRKNECKSYVVESVVNEDGSWYRKYSDGWLEQGGKASGSGGTNKVVTFLKPYLDTNYSLQVNHSQLTAYSSSTATAPTDGADGAVDTAGSTNRHTTTGFYLNNRRGPVCMHKWRACGMGAE